MPTLHELKEQAVTDTPVILFECELPSGSTEAFSTHALTHAGVDYQPRLIGHSAFDLRYSSQEGIDGVAKISLTLANADSYYSQVERVAGWKGSRLTARFAFFDLKTGLATTAAAVIFRGLVNPPVEITESIVRLSAQSRLSMARYFLPDARIQRRCPWSFPSTEPQRVEAATGMSRGKYSGLFRCGYSADQPGGLGNLNGAAPYAGCDYTRASCEARGMFDRDGANNITRRFGGVEFVPASVLVRGFGEQRARESGAAENRARYNDYVPLAYGTVWVEPPVIFARNDGNLTHIEVLLGHGEIEGVVKVGVNEVEIPEGVSGRDMTATGWYNVVSLGGVSGGFNLQFTDGSGNPLGDPYGSMAVLAVSVPNRISEGRSVPDVRVLIEGLKIATYDESGTPLGEVFTNNPAWVMFDLLLRSGWTLDELDVTSFARAAVYCAEGIPATDLFGNATTIPRFQCNLAMRRRRSVADWIRGIGSASRLHLTYGDNGQLELRREANFAVQHAAKPAGSNSIAPLDGGWPAYEFGDGGSFSGIARRSSGESSVRLWSRDTADTPNRISIEFQDEFNEYQQDSLSLVDVEDAGIVRQEISVTSPAAGLPNFHQAARALTLYLNKAIRGNTYVSLETSVRAVGLRPGDLITLTYQKEGLDRQPFRITRMVPGLNHATALIEAQIHDDSWYSDDPAQGSGSQVSRRSPGGGVGSPRPLVGTTLDPSGESHLGIIEVGELDGDGISSVLLEASFKTPVRPVLLGLDVPRLSLAAVVGDTGGTLEGGQTLYYGVTAVNANGDESELSFVVRAKIPATTNTNRVTLQQLKAAPSAVAFQVYRGETPAHLVRIASMVPVAAAFEDSGLSATPQGPPDGNFDHARLEWRLELQPEVTADTFSSNTIGSGVLQLIADEYVGMAVRITGGKGRGQERIITGHTANLITIRGWWASVPDGTSVFVIVESGWRLGSVSVSSPGRFNVPNRPGATVHVVGLAVSALGRHSGYETAPVTRWQIGGTAGTLIDADVPPIPLFGLQRTGRGGVELSGVSFSTLTNTRTITAGTLSLHYWDELAAGASATLTNTISDIELQLMLDTAVAVSPGSLLQIGAELFEVDAVGVGGTIIDVLRGSFGTTASTHGAGDAVYVLESKTYVVPFAREFFGSPASGSFGFPTFIPDVRVAAAEMFMTNTRGNGATRRLNFTGTTQQGIRTLSGGEITLQVDGPLAIQANATPPVVVDQAHSVGDIFAVVGEAPTGSPVTVQVRQDNTIYCTLTIPAGSAVSNIVNGFGLPPLQELAHLQLDIVSVSPVATDSPGRDLTIVIRL